MQSKEFVIRFQPLQASDVKYAVADHLSGRSYAFAVKDSNPNLLKTQASLLETEAFTEPVTPWRTDEYQEFV